MVIPCICFYKPALFLFFSACCAFLLLFCLLSFLLNYAFKICLVFYRCFEFDFYLGYCLVDDFCETLLNVGLDRTDFPCWNWGLLNWLLFCSCGVELFCWGFEELIPKAKLIFPNMQILVCQLCYIMSEILRIFQVINFIGFIYLYQSYI